MPTQGAPGFMDTRGFGLDRVGWDREGTAVGGFEVGRGGVAGAADAVCAALARRLPGYTDATPDLLQRRFLDTEGTIHNHGDQLVVRLNRRAYSPVLRAANLPPQPPCPGGPAAPSTTSSPADHTGVELAVWQSARVSLDRARVMRTPRREGNHD